MRWLFVFGFFISAILLLAGCPEEENGRPMQQSISILTFRYDAARDVVIATTRSLLVDVAITPQRYADTLSQLPEASYTPSPAIRLANPQATMADGVLTINYREVAGLERLSSAQTVAAFAAIEAWWWVPDVREVRLRFNGHPATVLGPVTLTQPLRQAFYTYVLQPATGEVGYLVGALTPADLAGAITLLRNRQISAFPAQQGFTSLLPSNVTPTANPNQIASGVLAVDLSGNFPRTDNVRMAGIVLMLTQFPTVQAVRFTFDGETINAPFMRGNLNVPLTPYDLLLPVAAVVAEPAVTDAVKTAAVKTLGQPVEFGQALVWKDLVLITMQPRSDAVPQTFLLKGQEGAYRVMAYGPNLPVAQLLQQGVPFEAVIAFRLPGWENLSLSE